MNYIKMIEAIRTLESKEHAQRDEVDVMKANIVKIKVDIKKEIKWK